MIRMLSAPIKRLQPPQDLFGAVHSKSDVKHGRLKRLSQEGQWPSFHNRITKRNRTKRPCRKLLADPLLTLRAEPRPRLRLRRRRLTRRLATIRTPTGDSGRQKQQC
jgi:hypothetical protein